MRLGVDLTPGGLALRQASGAAPGVEPGIVLNLATDSHVWDGTPLEGLTALPGWTYSRSGTGWARRSDGTYESFAADVPRRTDMGLWSEPASTNLFSRFAPSQPQLGSNANVTTVIEPDTPPIAGLSWLALNNTGGAAYAYQLVTLTPTTTYTMQIWVETPDGSPPVVGATSATGDFCLLLGGAILTGAGASGAVQVAALRSRTNDFRLARNGALSDADVSGMAPGGLVRLTLGGAGDGTGQLGGCLKHLVLRPVAKPDATLLSLSS